jgi:hypothetical protein
MILPVGILPRAFALLEARGSRRPAETLPFLVQQILRWRTVLKGSPEFTARGLRPLLRDFRELGFDVLPGTTPRWTKTQSRELEDLFLELALLVAAGPPLELPDLSGKPSDRLKLPQWLWNHVDHHGTALTLGLLESKTLAGSPEDSRYEAQAALRERIVKLASTLVPFAAYLAGPSGAEMTLEQGRSTSCSLLRELSIALDEAFTLGGPRGAWLARRGGWYPPVYPLTPLTPLTPTAEILP